MPSLAPTALSETVSHGGFAARDGVALAYTLYAGAERSPRIALVHSLAMDRQFWRPVAERLASDASVLIYDCRGHGASEKPPGPYTVEQFADDLADLLDHLGWRTTAVAGASMGGCVSIAFAAAYPQRTAALGLVDTTACYEAPKPWAERAEKARETGLESLVEFQTTRWFGDAFRAENPQIVEESVDVFLRNDIAAYAETCRMLGAADKRAALPALTMPTAVVVGEEDYATPVAMAQKLHDGIKDSTLTILKGARHLTPLERPDAIAAELKKLLKAGSFS